MKGFVPIDIPTKKYIKEYVISKLGRQPILTTDSDTIGNKFYDLLQHSTNERAGQFCSSMYTVQLRIYIPVRTFNRRGSNLNESNLKAFNLFIECEIKDKFYFLMDHLIELIPSFENNLPEVRRRLGIDVEAWSDDSMRKAYYRRNKRIKKPLLYNKKTSALTVR